MRSVSTLPLSKLNVREIRLDTFGGDKDPEVGHCTFRWMVRIMVKRRLGGRLTVGQQTLDLRVGVRIPASQPSLWFAPGEVPT